MKRWIACLLALGAAMVLCLAFAGCGATKEKAESAPSSSSATGSSILEDVESVPGETVSPAPNGETASSGVIASSEKTTSTGKTSSAPTPSASSSSKGTASSAPSAAASSQAASSQKTSSGSATSGGIDLPVHWF